MATSFVFNPLSGNFDIISTVAIGSPANGLSIDAAQTLTLGLSSTSTTGALSSTDWNTFNGKLGSISIGALDGQAANANGLAYTAGVLYAQSADATHPGLVNNTTQTLSGAKTFSSLINANGGIDRSTSGTLTIGATNSTTINIGNAGATVNIQGTTIYENTPILQVTDPLITVNKGGGAGSGQNAGIEIEENSLITGYAETSSDRNSWILKAPNTAGIATVTPGAGGITLDQSSHNPVTLGTANGLSLSTQVLSLQAADASHTGALTSTDWSTFNGKQPAGTYVTAITIASSNGFTGSSSGGATPALTLATSITGVLKGNGTALSAATAGTDYSAGTSALATGILKSTTTTGALTIAVAGDFPTLNQNTSGTAAGLSATLVVGSGGTGVTSVTTAPAATAFAGWDANKNLSANSSITGFRTQATAASTLTLVIGDAQQQFFTGTTAGQIVKLPTTSVVAGVSYTLVNNSTQTIAVQSSGANAIITMAASTQGVFTALVATPTAAADWNSYTIAIPATVTAGYFMAGPTSGAAAAPNFRAMVGSDIAYTYTAQTGTYSAVIGDYVNCTSGTFTVTLPTAASQTGKSIKIKNSGTGVITIATTSSQTIDGLATTVIKMGTFGDILIVTSDGTNWIVDEWGIATVATAQRITSNQTLTKDGTREIVFNSAVDDTQGIIDTGTGRLTVIRSGYYQVDVNVTFLMGVVPPTLNYFYLFKGGSGGTALITDLNGGMQTPSAYYSWSASKKVKLAAGDYISVFAYPTGQDISAVAGAGGNSYISIVLVGV